MPILQGRLRGKRWIAGAGNHGCWLGSYELQIRAAIESAVAPGSTFFDVGANTGYYTLLTSELVGASGRVVAFEPLPANLAYLKRHLKLNLAGNVSVLPVAVSDREGTTRFGENPSPAMGRREAEGAREVPAATLDGLVSSGRIPRPDCLRIDVKGAESEVLAGGQRLFAEHRPTLFLSTYGHDLRERCRRRLAAWGYRLSGLGGMPLEDSAHIYAEAGKR